MENSVSLFSSLLVTTNVRKCSALQYFNEILGETLKLKRIEQLIFLSLQRVSAVTEYLQQATEVETYFLKKRHTGGYTEQSIQYFFILIIKST